MRSEHQPIRSVTCPYDSNLIEVDGDTGMPDCGDRVAANIQNQAENDSPSTGWEQSFVSSFIVDSRTDPNLEEIWASGKETVKS